MAPGNMLVDGSRRYVVDVDPTLVKRQFRQLLQLPDSELPLERLCYLICQLAGDDIDIAALQAHHDALAAAIEPTFEAILSSLFGENGQLAGNTENYYAFDNSLLSRVQSSGRGLPITLCVQALAYAQRLGVPMVGVGMPGHFIIRCGLNTNLFGDPFHHGATFDAVGARCLFERITGSASQWQESFLSQVSTRDIVYRVLNNLRVATANIHGTVIHLPWILELASWFPQGASFTSADAKRLMAQFN